MLAFRVPAATLVSTNPPQRLAFRVLAKVGITHGESTRRTASASPYMVWRGGLWNLTKSLSRASLEDGATLYELTITTTDQSENRTYGTLEAALDSFDPPLSARVRSHIVEGMQGEGKPVVFRLEDACEEQ